MIFKELYVSRKEPVRIQTTQYTNAVPLVFRIMDWEIPSSALVQIYVKKPSGALVFNSGEIDGNDIIVTATTQMTAEVGDSDCQIRVEANNKVLHTFVFTLEVSETIIDDSAIESQDEFTALETALAEVENFVPKTAVASKGSATQPIYFDADGVAQLTNPLTNYTPLANVRSKGSSTKPIYFDSNGVAQTLGALGSSEQGIYVNSGGQLTVKNEDGIIYKGKNISIGGDEESILTWIKANFVPSKWIYGRITPSSSGLFGMSSFSIMANLSSANYGWGWLESDNAFSGGVVRFRIYEGEMYLENYLPIFQTALGSASSSFSINLPNAGQYIVCVTVNGINYNYIAVVNVYSAGNVYLGQIYKGSDITASAATRKINITSTTAQSYNITVISMTYRGHVQDITVS